MNNIKNTFTINDLENISGIKAHTIRIWEKRYAILKPERLGRNIRLYNTESLQKILNVALLNNHGYKISKIAEFSEEEIIRKTREFVFQEFKNDKALASLKMCMYKFDTALFNQIYSEQIQIKSFSEVFKDLFIPFLNFIGLNWQTKSLTPAHEHFISNLIYQKIQLNIENLDWDKTFSDDKTYVLYLPEEEMHEIGLLYLNYELLLNGKKTIYLGRSIPITDLELLQEQLEEPIVWVSQFTVSPKFEETNDYLSEVSLKLTEEKNEFWAIGRKFSQNEENIEFKNIIIYSSIEEVIKKI